MQHKQKIAVIIPAKDEAARIANTIHAARKIPHTDLVIVVDDGSKDATRKIAQEAGALTVQHKTNRGKAAAMETGAKTALAHDPEGQPPRLLLFLDADLQDSALSCAPLIEPVIAGTADCTIAYLPPQKDAGGHGFVTGLGRKAIRAQTGWVAAQPLSGQRCLTRAAFNAACPLASGWGVEVGMTLDLLTAGFTLQEIPCQLQHRATKNDLSGILHRAKQYKDVWRAVMSRRIRGKSIPAEKRSNADTSLGTAFNAYRSDAKPENRNSTHKH